MLAPFLLVAMSRATATDPIDGMHTLPSVQSLGQPTSANVMAFHGGHIMGTAANISVYLLYYGNAWHDQSEQPTVDLVTHFVNHVSSSPYWAIVRSYNATPAAAAQLVVAQQLYVPALAPTVDRASARSTLSATIADGTGALTVMFYGRTHIPGLEPGARIRLAGKVSMRADGPAMINPAYELLAKLFYKVGDGKLSISYELYRPHAVVELAIKDLIEDIAQATGIPDARGLLLGDDLDAGRIDALRQVPRALLADASCGGDLAPGGEELEHPGHVGVDPLLLGVRYHRALTLQGSFQYRPWLRRLMLMRLMIQHKKPWRETTRENF
jgi:hypothetical protein